MAEGITCPYCGNVNEEQTVFCGRCGFRLMDRCAICGNFYIIETGIVCPNCGNPLTAGKELKGSLEKRLRIFYSRFWLCSILFALVVAFGVFFFVWGKSLGSIAFYAIIILEIICCLILLFNLFNAYYKGLKIKKMINTLKGRKTKR